MNGEPLARVLLITKNRARAREVLKDLGMVEFDKGDIVWNGENESNERRPNNQEQKEEKP